MELDKLKPVSDRIKESNKDIIGSIFGRLKITSFAGIANKSALYVFVDCSCGTMNKIVQLSSLKNGNVCSCGCYGKEQRLKSQEKYNVNGKFRKDSSEVRSYKAMVSRVKATSGKAKKNYSDLNINVSDSWLGFGDYELGLKTFLEDMGPKPSEDYEIDRIDVTKGYSKENCRWVDRSKNQFNKRLSSKNNSGRTGVVQKKNKAGQFVENWLVYIYKDHKTIYLGTFNSFQEAVKCREEAEIEMYGEYKSE